MFLLDLPQDIRENRMSGFFDDFLWYISPHLWTTLTEDSATIAVGNLVNGVCVLTTGATDNDECAIATTNKPFTVLNNQPILFEACIQYTDAATNEMDIFVGLSSVLGTADMLADTTGLPVTTYDGAGITKCQGTTVWKAHSSRGTTQFSNTSAVAAGGTAYQRLRIEIQPISSLVAEVVFFINGVQMIDSTSGLPIKQIMTYASAAAMQAGVYIKADSAVAQAVNVDYVACYQGRVNI